ncbi:MAG: hypothetical protein Q8934_19750 [Bacillota bacterium]|nr:hypothetical protein [Bacillota bacterium]
MLKKVKKLQKEFSSIIPLPDKSNSKYTLSDWSEDDIRKVIFPKGRAIFDSNDNDLLQKWNETDWKDNQYLSLLTVPELKRLESWIRGVENA